MSCRECDRLRAQLAEATDELEEWRRQEAEGARGVPEADRLARWTLALKTRGGLANVAMWFADHPGQLLVGDRAIELYRAPVARKMRPVDEIEGYRYQNTIICLLRQALRGMHPEIRFETVWGRGYSMSAEHAARLKQFVGETP